MNLGDGRKRVDFLVGSDVNSYTNEKFLINLNIWNDNITGMAIRKSGTWTYDDPNNTGDNVTRGDLVAGQKAYSIPVNTKFVRRVEVNGKEAKLLNEKQIEGSIDDQTDFTTDSPRYELRGGSIHLYPTPAENVTKGLVWMIDRDAYQFTLSDLTTGTKEPGYDRAYHDMLFTGVAWEWAKAKQKPVAKDLAGDLVNYSINLGLDYAAKDKSEDMQMQSAYTNYN